MVTDGASVERLTAAVLLFAGSSALFVCAAVMVLRTWGILRRGITVCGTVAFSPPPDGVHEGRPSVEYHRLTGDKAVIAGVLAVRLGHLQSGDQVSVVYEPGRKRRHRVLGFADLWLAPLVIAALALALGAAGLVSLS